jgi:hypothetical protein
MSGNQNGALYHQVWYNQLIDIPHVYFVIRILFERYNGFL